MEYFILIYCPGRSNVRLEEAESSVWVIFDGINRNKMLWCENYAQKKEAQPQFKFKHCIFLNKINVTTIAAFKKKIWKQQCWSYLYFLYIDML